MSSPVKRGAQRDAPSTPVDDSFRVPGPVSADRLAQQAKRALDSPSEKRSKRKKKSKQKASSTRDSSPDTGDDPATPEPASRFAVPVLLTKAGAKRLLGEARIVPCYECIRSMTNESFLKHPNRCFDVLHETRAGVNSQCSTCARKHVSPCVPIPAEFLADSDKLYDDFEKEGLTKRVRDAATALVNRMPAEPVAKKNRAMSRSLDLLASPSPSLEPSRVSEETYSSVLTFMTNLGSIPADLRSSVRKAASEWLRNHEARSDAEEETS